MADFRKLIPVILKGSSGFIGDAETLNTDINRGIPLAIYADYYHNKGLEAPNFAALEQITEEEWEEIVKIYYWDRWKADRILNQSVANLLVDWLWVSGEYGIKVPQRILGLSITGQVDQQALTLINTLESGALFNSLFQERINYINRICISKPVNKKFKKSWINRVYNFKYASTAHEFKY